MLVDFAHLFVHAKENPNYALKDGENILSLKYRARDTNDFKIVVALRGPDDIGEMM